MSLACKWFAFGWDGGPGPAPAPIGVGGRRRRKRRRGEEEQRFLVDLLWNEAHAEDLWQTRLAARRAQDDEAFLLFLEDEWLN